MKKKISVLGSTGSIGTQTLDIIPDIDAEIMALTTNRNIELLETQARRFRPKLVAAYQEDAAKALKIALKDTDIKVYSGMDGLIAAAEQADADTVVTAVVGMVGLLPTLSAIHAGKDIALANKETLVCAGDLVMQEAQKHHVKILPVDSEHSAIFQCAQAQQGNTLAKIILTASGGPFAQYTAQQLQNVTLKDALKHPNWSMGAKITVDSATMINKGLELIEAMWLYHLPEEDIEVVVHRESIVHSLIEFVDGAVLAQLGMPDMRLPIQYALTYPQRLTCKIPRLRLSEIQSLTFTEPNEWAQQSLALARQAARKKGTAGAILNGANEAAVAMFLANKIPFYRITELVAYAMEQIPAQSICCVEEVLSADAAARQLIMAQLS